MKRLGKLLPAAAVALTVALGSQATLAEENTEQQRERVETQAQKREQIYGSQMMNAKERAAYQNRIRNAKSEEARNQVRAEHQRMMQERAEKQKRLASDAARNGKAQTSRFEQRNRLENRSISRSSQGRTHSGGGRRGN